MTLPLSTWLRKEVYDNFTRGAVFVRFELMIRFVARIRMKTMGNHRGSRERAVCPFDSFAGG